MKNKKDISIVIGSYNRKKYFKLTIDSIRRELENLNLDCEIIVIDGGSDDGTLDWLVKQKDIITMVQHNRGIWRGKEIKRRSWGYFMNLGFKAAQGKYICMLSDDCLIIPGAIKNGFNYFEKQLQLGRNVGAVAFYWRDWPKFSFYYAGLVFGKIFVNHGMYLNSALTSIGYIDEDFYFYHADGDLCLKLWDHGFECLACPDSFIEHYSHANISARKSNNIKQSEDYKKLLKKWDNIFINSGPEIQQLSYISLQFEDRNKTFQKFMNSFVKIKHILKEYSAGTDLLSRIKKMNFKNSLNSFQKFEHGINKKTWVSYDKIINSSENKYKNDLEIKSSSQSKDEDKSDERIIILESFDKKYINNKQRILIHMPKPEDSPGGFSLFNNLYQSLNYIGISADVLYFGESVEKKLELFKPTCLLTSDHESWLRWINWHEIQNYREKNDLKIGLTASIEEYGNTPLLPRLEWAKKVQVDFYYSFRSRSYFESRVEYKPFFEAGFSILNIEFGANPLLYFPIKGIERDIDYVFLGSNNPDKMERYNQYFTEIFKNYKGFIHGPGWTRLKKFQMNTELDRYFYSRAKVGLNLHLQEQIDWPCELNERTYMLAACGVPQLIDQPGLLVEHFSSDCFFIADNPKDYYDLFKFILDNPEEANRRSEISRKEVLAKHTTLHRAEQFIKQYDSLFNN